MRRACVVSFVFLTAICVPSLAQQTATTKDGRVVILKPDGTWEYAKSTAKTTPPPAAMEPQPKPPMTAEQKVATWKGEKVVLLVNASENRVTESGTSLVYKRGATRTPLSASAYGGKQGTIVATRFNATFTEVDIRLDATDEEIFASFEYGYGFLSEMEIAKGLLGKRLWAKGRVYLEQPGRLSDSKFFQPLSPLTVTDAAWDSYGIRLHVRSDSGAKGVVGFRNDYKDCFDKRLHVKCERSWEETDLFFLQDPRSLHPQWPETIWQAIEAEEIQVGMTLDMLRAVCGASLRRIGGQLLEGKSALADVFECQEKKLLVSNQTLIEWKNQ